MIAEQDPRFQNLKKKLGLFALVALLLLSALIFMAAYRKDFFTKKYELIFTVERGTGFNRGMPVKLSGFMVGRIKSISLNDAARIDIVLQIDKKYQNWIRKDSTAKLIKEGLVGEPIVEISIGSPTAAVLENGGHLQHVKTRSLDQLADEIAEKVKPVLIEVRDIISYVNDPEGDLKKTVENFRVLSENLEITRKKTDILLTRAGSGIEAVSGKLVSTLTEASATVSTANTSLKAINEKLPGLLLSAENSLKNVEKISSDLKQTEEKVLPRIPVLVRSSEEALEGTSNILNAVKDIWPINRYLPPRDEKAMVPGDSHE